MSRAFSIYLDLLRFIAACLVVVYHASSPAIVGSMLPLSGYGHTAVIIFFVLSGYVIAYATDTKETSADSYWASRFSRIWSLAVPAILLTPMLDMAGAAINPAVYAGATTHDHALLRIGTSLLFLNELWTVSIMSFSNVAYWSLNYEVWYYVLFALYAFSAPRWRWVWIGAVSVLLGPKIMLLAPIWVIGVVIYRWRRAQQMPEWLGWTCLLLSIVLFAAMEACDVVDQVANQLKAVIGAHWYRQLNFSRWFLTDYMMGLVVFLNFIGVRRVVFRFDTVLHLVERPVRALAAYTFSLYILHQPLLYFFAAAIDLPPADGRKIFAILACVAAAVFLIGYQTERKRFALRRWLATLIERGRGYLDARPAVAGTPGNPG